MRTRELTLFLAVAATAAGSALADPTARRWIAAEGYVNEATSWNGGTLPTQGDSSANGDEAYFTGSTDMTVKFPAGGWTDTGVYYFARELTDGCSLTFDATGTTWSFGAGKYYSTWQVFTLCGGASGASYPHLLQVTVNNAACKKPVFSLNDGVLSLYKDMVNGSSLTLSRGTWDFTCGDANNYLIFFAAEAGKYDQFILKDGTSFKTPRVDLKPGKAVADTRFLIEGGNHIIGNLYAGNGENSAPVLVEVAGGTTTVGNGYIGYRKTTDANRVLVKGDAKLSVTNLQVACSEKAATVDVIDNGTLEVIDGLNLGKVTAAVTARLTVTNNATLDAAGGTVRIGYATANNGEAVFAGNSTFDIKAMQIGGGYDITANNVTGRVVIAENAKGTIGKLCIAGTAAKNCNYQGLNGTLEMKDDAELTLTGYLQPCYGTESTPCFADIIIGGRARLLATAANDYDGEGGGFYFGSVSVNQVRSRARMLVKDDAYVETGARTTLGAVSAVSNVLEVCGNATFVSTNISGIIMGRNSGGRGYLIVRENGKIELPNGPVSLSGDLQWGDNLGGEERVEMLGGSIAAKALTLTGTNAWVNLAGGTTTFDTWSVCGMPKYGIADANWILPTNTIHVTGGTHNLGRSESTSIAIGATNGNARVWIDGGTVNAAGGVKVGDRQATGAPGMLSVSGGTLKIFQKDDSISGNSRLMLGTEVGTKGRFDFTGGEVIANEICGGDGDSTLVADGGKFTVLNVASRNALGGIKEAKLGENGITVSVPNGLSVTNAQAFADLDDAEGTFRKIGAGKLVTIQSSQHAKTTVEDGVMIIGSGVKTFGKALEIASSAYVIVTVPATVGTHDVLTLASEMTSSSLARLVPEVWTSGYNYEFSQSTSEGVTTVSCTVSAGGEAGRDIGETTQFTTPQRLIGHLKVTAANVTVTFKDLVEIVGDTLVIDVPAGSTVAFDASIASATCTVRKQGAGRVIFGASNPYFYGTWQEAGGYFDIRDAAFSANGIALTLETDTLRYAGEEPGVVDSPVTIKAASVQHRVVIEAAADVTLAGGLNSTAGGIVKTGSGKLSIVEAEGSYSLNTGDGAAGDSAVSSIPDDGAAPPASTVVQWGNMAGAGLQILEGAVKLKGQGIAATTINNRQSIYIGTAYSAQKANVGLEVENCTYNADGTSRSMFVGHQCAQDTYNHPYLLMRNVKLVNHRIQVAGNDGNTWKDLYADAKFFDSEIVTESGFQVGSASDKNHSSVTLSNTKVTQRRDGYAMGHWFGKDVKFVAMSNSLLNATYTAASAANWKGIQFQSGAWGTIKFTTGATLQTSLFTILNTGATSEKHIDLIFDDGTLDMTGSCTVTFAAPQYQGFTTEGAGMMVKLDGDNNVTFATPFRGDGRVRKIGSAKMILASIADGGEVFRHNGATEIAAGELDLGGGTATVPKLCGAGSVCNGTLNGSLLGTIGGDANGAIALGENLAFGDIRLEVANPEAIAEGVEFPIARIVAGGSEPSEEEVKSWRGKLTGEFSATGSAIRNDVVYAKIVPRSGMLLILR